MSLLALTLIAAAVDASPLPTEMDPGQRDSQCLVALRAEPRSASLHKAAERYFDERVRRISDPELRELLMITAEEAILPNTNRGAIASTCLLLYQVLIMQEKQHKPVGR